MHVEAPAQGYLEVLTRDVPDDINLRARFATYDEWGEEKENFLTDNKRTPAAVPVYEEGKYYVRVKDRRNRNYSKEEFYIKINFTEEFDLFEPNNDAPSANKIEFDKEYKSAIFPTEDRDWFSVEVKKQGYLNIGAKNIRIILI